LDEQQEKTDRMEFLKAAGDFLREAVPAATQSPQLAPLLMEMLKFGVTGFKVGKTIEGEFDAMADKLKQSAAQPPEQKPDPEQIKIQAQQQQAQQQAQVDMAKHQAEMQQRQQEQQMQAQIEQHKNEMEAQRAAVDAQGRAQIEQMRMQHEDRLKGRDLEFEKYKLHVENETKLIIAQVSAQSLISQQQDDAADAALSDEEIEQQRISKLPLSNHLGHRLHRDANGNHAYVGQNGEVTEV
jgi:hypothetical protein